MRADLDSFLAGRGLAVKRLPKGAPDRSLAMTSREERLVLVTNDEDFAALPAEKVFSVVLLRIPQRDGQSLLASFGKLLSECRRWQGRRIVLEVMRWTATRLGSGRRARHAA